MRYLLQRIIRAARISHAYKYRKFVLSTLIFAITYRCNFRCRSCYYANVMDNNILNVEKELTIDEIKKISLSMTRFDTLMISGGEPFLRDDIVEICQIFYCQNQVRNIHLPTNGFYSDKIYNFTREILQTCPQISLTLGLPLDGLRETHDKIKGKQGSFEKVIETASSLSALRKEFCNLHIYIITVVNNLNLNEIIRLADFVKSSLPFCGFGPSPVRGMPYDKTLRPPSGEEWAELSKSMLRYRCYRAHDPLGPGKIPFLDMYKQRYYDKLLVSVMNGGKLPFRCQGGNTVGVLEPNGDVRLCELMGTVGNVRLEGYDFKRAWFSDSANYMRGKIDNCACTHACFLYPSIEMHWPIILNSYICDKLQGFYKIT
jgi:MoaA/NifB/PqqE/SkfB family radical SAM enzyme